MALDAPPGWTMKWDRMGAVGWPLGFLRLRVGVEQREPLPEGSCPIPERLGHQSSPAPESSESQGVPSPRKQDVGVSTGIRDLPPSVPCPTLGSALLSLATPLIRTQLQKLVAVVMAMSTRWQT